MAAGGSLFLALTSNELVARSATLLPPPRVHAVRYRKVFAPNSNVCRRGLFPPAYEVPDSVYER